MTTAQATFLCLIAITQAARPATVVEVHGRVVLPDGLGASGATVSAVTDCRDYHLVVDAVADGNGYYTIRVERPAGCTSTQFFASDRSHFWLKTGIAVFYRRPNGEVPTLDLGAGPPAMPLVIPLALRGGTVSIQLKDSSSGRFVHAHLLLDLSGNDAGKYGSMQIATGEDGSPDVLFLPPAEYVASVALIGPESGLRAVVRSPKFTFQVVEATDTKTVFEVDVRKLSVLKDADPDHHQSS